MAVFWRVHGFRQRLRFDGGGCGRAHPLSRGSGVEEVRLPERRDTRPAGESLEQVDSTTSKPARGAARNASVRLTNDHPQILAWLRELEPLPKVHYSWTVSGEMLDDPKDRRLFEYTCITHALSVNDYTKPLLRHRT